MAALATTAELAPRLSFVMDEDDEREADGALEDLSEDARHYGSQAWIDQASTPDYVINLILRAAARHMKNYEGYTMSRAGDETVQWTDRGESSGTATFTKEEIKALKGMAGRTGFGTIPLAGFGKSTRPTIGYVPVAPAPGKDFPYFADPVEPW